MTTTFSLQNCGSILVVVVVVVIVVELVVVLVVVVVVFRAKKLHAERERECVSSKDLTDSLDKTIRTNTS